jgi:putative proteasome-type protease
MLMRDGIVLASDSRTNAGLDDVATFCKMTVFERVGERVLVLLSSGNLAGTPNRGECRPRLCLA